MATARREAALTMRKTDVVIEVLDARVPGASLNPMVEELRKENQRPALLLLNKADAADPKRTAAWLAHYNAQPQVRAVALSATHSNEVKRIPKLCLELAPSRTSLAKPLRMMILGIPNVGKSTLMNTLLQRHIAKVGDEPAVTKMQAKHALGKTMWIIDTPGMLWPGVGQAVALLLAASHSIGRNAYDEETVALDLARILLRDYPDRLAQRFGALSPGAAPSDVLVHIAQTRSMVGTDTATKAAIVLLNDFRMGKLGRITLEAAPRREEQSAPA